MRLSALIRPALAAAAFVSLAGLPALAGPTTTVLSGPSGPSHFGQTVDFTATVTGAAPSGTVTLKDGSKTVGTGTLATPIGGASTIAAGRYHTCALTAAGAAMCWGRNTFGQAGANAGAESEVPVVVEDLESGAVAVTAGKYFTCAITDAGAVLCWGENGSGSLGNNSTTTSYYPVAVWGLSSGYKAVTAGQFFACALSDAGAVKCWGENTGGQLGVGTKVDSLTPVAVQGLPGPLTAIAAGDFFVCGLTEAGSVVCWGANDYGQVGDGTTTDRTTPTPVAGLTGTIVAIAAGESHVCALNDSGAVKCWGGNDQGQLGDGTKVDSLAPVAVETLSSGVAAISVSSGHSCAIMDNGAAKCWGANEYGQIGDTTTDDKTSPVQVSGLTGGVAAIEQGTFHTCALKQTGAAVCWGRNNFGQVGDATYVDSHTPADVSGFGDHTAFIGPATATISTDALAAGTRQIKARYNGGTGNAASTSDAVSVTVDKGDTKIKQVKVAPKTPKAGKTARVTVKLKALAPAKGKPDGKVVVKDGKKKLGTYKVKNAKAGFKWKPKSRGKHKLKFTFKGDKNWAKSTAKKTVTVKK